MNRIVAASIAIVGLLPGIAAAQTVTLTPSVIQLKGTVGQSTTQRLTMTNASSMDLTFVLEAQDVVVTGGRRVFVGPGEIPGSIARTVVFSQRSVVIPSGQSRSVTVTVTVPRDVSNRAVVALFRGTTKIPSGDNMATASLGALLTFTLSDHVSLSPAELIVQPQSPTANTSFELPVANSGTEPVAPKGMVAILDARGRLVGRAPFEEKRLLPGERVTFRSEYSGDLGPGSYRVLSTFEYAGTTVSRSAQLVIP